MQVIPTRARLPQRAHRLDREMGEHQPDHVLVKEAQAGSSIAFDQLAGRYYPIILRYLTRKTSDVNLAADLTQETFLDAWRDLNRLADDRAFAPWLYRIARNNLLPVWRKRQPESVDQLTEQDSQGNPALHQTDPVLMCFERDLIQRVLYQLSASSREALLLHSLHGFTSEEVGRILGISGEAARKRIGRAKAEFRKEYTTAC